MEEKKNNIDRARQFLPFASLRGFDEALERHLEKPEEKRELCAEDKEHISYVLNEINKRDMVKITYYEKNRYVTKRGMVSEIDYTRHFLRVIKDKVYFGDITEIEKI